MMQGMSAKKDKDAEAAERMLAAAAKFYKQAAEMYPPDDEYFPCTCLANRPPSRSLPPRRCPARTGHRASASAVAAGRGCHSTTKRRLTQHTAPDFLKVAFEAEWHRGRPLAETLPVCDRIRKALPAVLKIWASGPSTPLQENMQQLARWETRAYTGLLQDRYTLQTPSVSLAPSSLARSLHTNTRMWMRTGLLCYTCGR